MRMSTSWVSSHGYSFSEELANNVVQGVGILLSLIGLVVLVMTAADGGVTDVAASAIFGAALVLLYTVSTLYHALPAHVAPRVLGQLDHVAIYLLIAGTYTPFALVALGGASGWWMFGAIWTLAACGTAIEFSPWRDRRWLAIALYLGMGWLGMVSFGPLSAKLHGGGMALLLAGGAAYTLGVPFHLWRSLRFHNVLWHGFVLTGSVLHFFAVLLYVLP
jgi:hemolysin III